MATLVYKLSRFIPETNKLRLAEYYKSNARADEDPIKASATLHFDLGFVNGIPLAEVKEDGEKRFFFNRSEEYADEKLMINISLPESILEQLRNKVDDEKFYNPTANADGVSLLRKWQVHIVLETGAHGSLTSLDNEKAQDTGFLTQYIEESWVKDIKLVSTKDKEYVHVPKQNQVSLETLVDLFTNPTEQEETKVASSPEEVKEVIEKVLSRAQRRGANRRKDKAAAQVKTVEVATPSITSISEDDFTLEIEDVEDME